MLEDDKGKTMVNKIDKHPILGIKSIRDTIMKRLARCSVWGAKLPIPADNYKISYLVLQKTCSCISQHHRSNPRCSVFVQRVNPKANGSITIEETASILCFLAQNRSPEYMCSDGTRLRYRVTSILTKW